MKPSFSLTLSLLLCISLESIIQVNATCWEHPNPFKPWERVASKICGTQKKTNKLVTGKGKGLDENIQSLEAKDAFQIDFSCGVNNQTLCDQAKNAFIEAGQIIANTINLVNPIVVNATFTDFCRDLRECSGNILGAAGAARTIPLLDDDGVVRQYPQALAKQFPLSPTPLWGPFDIQAFFNAEANMFFKGNGEISPTQFDFQYIILHELIHGLGFASSWNDYFMNPDRPDQPVALTPAPKFLESVTNLNDPVTFTGFEELAFDKYMYNTRTNPPQKMTNFTNDINSFAKIGTKFPTVQNLFDLFESSKSFGTTQVLLKDSQTPKTMGFLPHNAKGMTDLSFLETNLNPFKQGSSVSHMDIVTFGVDPDFLMVFKAKQGKTLDQIMIADGGKKPIGPKLQSILETLGYATSDNPNPYRPTLPKDSVDPASTNPTTSSPNSANNKNPYSSSATYLKSSFNILSIFIIMAVTLLF